MGIFFDKMERTAIEKDTQCNFMTFNKFDLVLKNRRQKCVRRTFLHYHVFLKQNTKKFLVFDVMIQNLDAIIFY